MTVIVTTGNIFESETEIITDANNSIGISGAGLAAAFAKRYPRLSDYYNDSCKYVQEQLTNNTGKNGFLLYPSIFAKGFLDNDDYAVCKFPTMIYPGSITKEKDIESNLLHLRNKLEGSHYSSIALPALGCGIGRYSFDKLEKQVKEIFSNGFITVHLYRPS